MSKMFQVRSIYANRFDSAIYYNKIEWIMIAIILICTVVLIGQRTDYYEGFNCHESMGILNMD